MLQHLYVVVEINNRRDILSVQPAAVLLLNPFTSRRCQPDFWQNRISTLNIVIASRYDNGS